MTGKFKETTTEDGIKVSVKEWTIQERLQYQNTFMPLIQSIMVNGAAVSGENDESIAYASLIKGIMEGLQGLDMTDVCGIVFNGGGITFPGKPKTLLSFEALEANEADLPLIYTIIAFFVQVNYGSLLKKGLEDFLVVLMGTEV